MRQAGVDAAQAARDHDGLVIAPARVAGGLLEAAEIAQQVGTAEFVVEGGAADGAVDHDGQRRGDAVRQAVMVGFPGLRRIRKAQVRHGEVGQAGLAWNPGRWRLRRGISPPAPVDAPGNGAMAVG